MWKPFWMDIIVARIMQDIFGLKLLVVKNFSKNDKYFMPGFSEARERDALRRKGDVQAEIYNQKCQEFWPYVEYVHETKDNSALSIHEHFVVLNNHQNQHFEIFFSNFYRKGIFTFDELRNSPTLSVLFKQIVQQETFARFTRDATAPTSKSDDQKDCKNGNGVPDNSCDGEKATAE